MSRTTRAAFADQRERLAGDEQLATQLCEPAVEREEERHEARATVVAVLVEGGIPRALADRCCEPQPCPGDVADHVAVVDVRDREHDRGDDRRRPDGGDGGVGATAEAPRGGTSRHECGQRNAPVGAPEFPTTDPVRRSVTGSLRAH